MQRRSFLLIVAVALLFMFLNAESCSDQEGEKCILYSSYKRDSSLFSCKREAELWCVLISIDRNRILIIYRQETCLIFHSKSHLKTIEMSPLKFGKKMKIQKTFLSWKRKMDHPYRICTQVAS